jgi:hypothetical protein
MALARPSVLLVEAVEERLCAFAFYLSFYWSGVGGRGKPGRPGGHALSCLNRTKRSYLFSPFLISTCLAKFLMKCFA